jgi:hypothetical protein
VSGMPSINRKSSAATRSASRRKLPAMMSHTPKLRSSPNCSSVMGLARPALALQSRIARMLRQTHQKPTRPWQHCVRAIIGTSSPLCHSSSSARIICTAYAQNVLIGFLWYLSAARSALCQCRHHTSNVPRRKLRRKRFNLLRQ